MAITVDVSPLTSAGKYLTVPELPSVFVCSLPVKGTLSPGSIATKQGFYLTAFSRRCTHLGCNILPDTAIGQAIDLPSPDYVVTCPCHFSAFDLVNRALTVQGPATDFLPRVALRGIDDPLTQVELISWIRDESVPYGVPFEGTSGQPLEKP